MSGRARREVVDVMTRFLGPFIGETMVRASVNGHWDKLNLGPVLDDDGIGKLLAALGPGLNVFVGRRKGEALVAEVELALRATDKDVRETPAKKGKPWP